MLSLFTGSGVGPTILYLALSIFIGLLLGKIKIAKISLGITWVLFVGIAFSACGISLNAEMLHVIKEFGLILFVVAVGLQVGPGFFRSFKKGGLAMNLMALVNVALGVLITFTRVPSPTHQVFQLHNKPSPTWASKELPTDLRLDMPWPIPWLW